MGDKFPNFATLSQHFQAGKDFRIDWEDRGGKILLLAPHGGGIERGTSELVRSIADRDLSYYLFEGRLSKYQENRGLHITSTNFDEPGCLDLIKKFDLCLSIHGCNGSEAMIRIGGSNDQLKETIYRGLKQKSYPVQFDDSEYMGTSPRNICNRTKTKSGVQLELSTEFRRHLFHNWKKRIGRETKTDIFVNFISLIREIII